MQVKVKEQGFYCCSTFRSMYCRRIPNYQKGLWFHYHMFNLVIFCYINCNFIYDIKNTRYVQDVRCTVVTGWDFIWFIVTITNFSSTWYLSYLIEEERTNRPMKHPSLSRCLKTFKLEVIITARIHVNDVYIPVADVNDHNHSAVWVLHLPVRLYNAL